jgi:ABC-type antimicrobial peptide transport system permease subunit
MEFGLLIYHGLQRSIVNGKLIKAVGVNFEENYGAPLFGDGIFTLAKEIRTNSVSVIVKLSDDWKKNYELFDYLLNEGGYSNEVYSKIKPYSQSTDVLDAAATWTNIFKTIFLYASIGISFFAGLMLMNFIGISIADKKKTIGILRAIGARSADVFKIFFSEGLIVSGIIFMLSFLSVVLISMIINSLFTMSVLIPTIIQALLMAVLSFGVMSIATILPIYKIAIKKPVDAINNK